MPQTITIDESHPHFVHVAAIIRKYAIRNGLWSPELEMDFRSSVLFCEDQIHCNVGSPEPDVETKVPDFVGWWKPIETAPTTNMNQPILLAGNGDVVVAHWYSGRWCDSHGDVLDCDNTWMWMPHPDPPKEK